MERLKLMSDLQLRVSSNRVSVEGEGNTVTGLAVPYNTETQLYKGLREQFKPGSFSEARADVRLLIGHDRYSLPLARTKSGTMELWETSRGLEFKATIDATTPQGQNALSTIRRGDLDGVSIGFAGDGDYDRKKDRDGTLISWTRVNKLHEISMVAFPAYPTTDIKVRATQLFQEKETMSSKEEVNVKTEVRAVVIKPEDTSAELFERSRNKELPDEVRDELITAAFDAVQREADKKLRDKIEETRLEDEDYSKPKIVRSSSDTPSLILTDDSEITDEQIRSRKLLYRRCIDNHYGNKDDFTDNERSLMARKLPSDIAFERWARALTREELVSAETEFRKTRSIEQRALGTTMNTGTDADGGHTVPEYLLPQLTLEMAHTGPMADPSASKRINVSNGQTMKIPKVTSTDSVKAIIEGEGDDIANYKPVFAQTSFTPYKYAMSYPVTSEMLQDTAVPITSFIAENFGIAFGRAMNEHFTTGSGSSQPQGVYTGATAYGTALSKTADLDKDDFVLVANLIDPAYAHGDKFFVQLTNASVGLLRKTLESGHFIFNNDSGNVAFPGNILGIPVRVNSALDNGKAAAKKVMLVGNHNYYVSVVVGSPQIDFSEHFAFGSDQVVYRAKWRFTGGVEIADAFRSFVTAT